MDSSCGVEPGDAGPTATRSLVRTRVASSDWWASRNVVSVTLRSAPPAEPAAKPSGPSSRSRCRVPVGAGCPRSTRGQLARRVDQPGRPLAVRGVDGDVGQIGQQPGAAVGGSAGGQQLRVVSMKLVVTPPAAKSGSSSTACRNGMFVATPRIRNSASARRALATACDQSRPRQVSLTSSESNDSVGQALEMAAGAASASRPSRAARRSRRWCRPAGRNGRARRRTSRRRP